LNLITYLSITITTCHREVKKQIINIFNKLSLYLNIIIIICIDIQMPSHNSFFGGLYSLKINYNNPILGMASYTETPYPPIIPDPNLLQIMKNWNIADTGLTLTTYVAFTLLSLRVMRRLAVREGSHNKRNSFLITNGTTFFICLAIGLRNSCYRLTGLVPNGLKKR
jgi:hypothetical protein